MPICQAFLCLFSVKCSCRLVQLFFFSTLKTESLITQANLSQVGQYNLLRVGVGGGEGGGEVGRGRVN